MKKKLEKETQDNPRPGLKRRWKILLGLLFLFVLYTAAGFWLLPRILKDQLAEKGSAALARTVSVDRVVCNPFTLCLELDGVLIEARQGRAPLCKIDKVVVDCAGFLSLVNRALVLESIRIEGPYIQIVRQQDLDYNFTDILQQLTAETSKTPKKTENERGFLFSFNNIDLRGGIVEFADHRQNTFHWINDIKITLPRISNLPKLVESRVQPSLSAVVNGTPLKIGGSAKPFARELETNFAINIDNLNLAYYLSYLPGKRNFSLQDGTLTTRLELVFKQPPKAPASLSLVGTVTLRNLLVQGRGKEHYRFLFLPEVLAEIGPGNLLQGEFLIRDLRVEKPEINLSFKPDGVFYLPMLVAAVAEQEKRKAAGQQPVVPSPVPAAPAAAKKPAFSFKLERFQLNQAQVTLRDARVSPLFVTRWRPVDFELKDLAYPGAARSVFSLSLLSEIGEQLTAQGDFVLEPGLALKTSFSLSEIPLARYVSYYDKYFAGRFRRGQVDLSGIVHLSRSPEGELELKLDDLGTTFKDLELSTPSGETICTLPRLRLSGGRLDLDKQEFEMGEVAGERGRFNLVRRAGGGFNFEALLVAAAPPAAAVAEPAKTEPAPAPWTIRLAHGRLGDFSLGFKDQSLRPAAKIELEKIDFEVRNLSTVPGESGHLKLNLNPAASGRLQIGGQVGLKPLRVGLDLDLKKLPLKPFQPYISQYLDLVLVRGTAAAGGQLQLSPGAEGRAELRFAGRAAIDRLRTVDGRRAADFLDLRHLGIEKIAFRSRPPQLVLGRIGVKGLKAAIRRNRKGRTNLDVVLRTEKSQSGVGKPEKPTPPAAAAAPAAAKKEALELFIEKVKIADSGLSFVDHAVSPTFKMRLSDLEGEVAGLGTLGKKPARVKLAGRLNQQAPVTVSGQINPLGGDFYADLKVVGRGIGLTDLSPYSGRYVGYAIGKGKATLNLAYKVERQQLEAQNDIFLDQFDFGSSVDSPEAVSLPVKLAVALLKDRKGEIHLNLPVNGDLSDPQFSVGGVIFKVLVNLITKAVTSPFALIGSLVGGGEELNLIDFAAGRAELDQKAQLRLDKLAKALYDRPALKVEIIGRAARTSDGRALHESAFKHLLQVEKFKVLVKQGKAPDSPDAVVIAPGEEFTEYLWLAYKSADFPRKKNFIGMIKKIEPKLQEKLLREHIEIGDGELKELARRRAKAVMHYLAAKGPIEPERLFLVAPQLVDDDTNGRRVELKIK